MRINSTVPVVAVGPGAPFAPLKPVAVVINVTAALQKAVVVGGVDESAQKLPFGRRAEAALGDEHAGDSRLGQPARVVSRRLAWQLRGLQDAPAAGNQSNLTATTTPSVTGTASNSAASSSSRPPVPKNLAFSAVLAMPCGGSVGPQVIVCGGDAGNVSYVCPTLVYRPSCAYWDAGSGAWSTAGCELVGASPAGFLCACTHLTDFGGFFSPVLQPYALQSATFEGVVKLVNPSPLPTYPTAPILAGLIIAVGLCLAVIGAKADSRGALAFYRALWADEEVGIARAVSSNLPFVFFPRSSIAGRIHAPRQ